MSLSKQLYIIISFIFFMIFTGNFIISIKNSKEYLEIESITKAQDTATSLGLTLKPLLINKKDPHIQSTINAIANRGFYKEIRLEDAFFTISEKELINSEKSLKQDNWMISNLSIDKKYGKIELSSNDNDLIEELSALENEEIENNILLEDNEKIYTFFANPKYKDIKEISLNFTVSNDSGIKKVITTKFTLNKIISKVTRKERFDYVPSWFINIVKIKLEEQMSEITNDWKTSAKIFVSANAGDAYARLYNEAKSTMIYSTIAFFVSMFFLFIFIRHLLKPLKMIERLAENIAKGNFSTIKELPNTTEIKSVAIAMNDMSSKIKNIIKKLNTNLEYSAEKLSQDSLTGLNLKQSFQTDVKSMFVHKSSGYIFVINIFDLSTFSKSHTNNETNEFIKKFALILKKTQINKDLKSTAYRFFGSEFAVIGHNYTYKNAQEFTKELQVEFEKLSKEVNKKDIVHIGASPFNPIATSSQILEGAIEAYEKATIIGPNEIFIRDSNDLSRDMEQWRDLIFDIIDNSKFKVEYIADAKLLNKKNTLVMQEAFTSACDNNDVNIPIGTFVSIAEKYEKIIDFDKKVINKVINHILKNKIKHEISINLSLESINNTAFIAWLEKTIKKHKKISSQLVFSITAYAVAKDINKFKFFVDEVHQCGAKVIIKRFESKFISLNNIKDLNLDYIRLARDYTQDISNDNSKQKFVEDIQELSSLLNIKIFAENVKANNDLKIIENLNLYAASR